MTRDQWLDKVLVASHLSRRVKKLASEVRCHLPVHVGQMPASRRCVKRLANEYSVPAEQ